ncbi:MAG: CDP-alcohol phosphatidyltransferase family protein [Alphaproteobacteria bacterium]
MRADRVPMLLSASRLALAPCFAAAVVALGRAGDRAAGPLALVPLAIAVVAAATDWIDGRLARKLGVVSSRGAGLDVAGDAAFVLCGLSALAATGAIVVALPAAAALALAAFALARRSGAPATREEAASARRGPARSPADALGHAAGVLNYAIVIAGAALPLVPAAASWVRASSVLVALLNLSPIAIRTARARSAARAAQSTRGSASSDRPPRDRA